MLRNCLAVTVCSLSLAAARGADPPDFERDVAPILVQHCLDCHQPSKKSGGLSLATLAATQAGGELGPALVPGKPAESPLALRTAAREMPPPDAKEAHPLTDAQIETLRAWVAAAANWPKDRELGIHERTVDLEAARKFWSFQPIRRASVPLAQNATEGVLYTAGNPIDAFIYNRLSTGGLHFTPPASRDVLLRRLSLDLRGLPPTLPEQVEFLADAAPDAYERLVDRLLADPAHGERWARHWLDLVRYADSNGYERDDAKPNVWKYRDYVIAALNGDKPYDRFVREQIAGDELPDASRETIVATGFHALGTWQDEVDPLEAAQYRADELDDMIRTTSQTFLGLTLGCARCHNHKFDPLSMVDYYSFAAILAPLKRPNEGRVDRDRPIGSLEQMAAEAKRDAAIAELEAQVAALEKQHGKEKQPDNVKGQIADLRAQQQKIRKELPSLPRAYFLYEDSVEAPATYLLLSGRASNPGPQMQPGVPAVVASTRNAAEGVPYSAGTRSTLRRLALADWLTSPDNPLTARVIVNRVWQHHFGQGLVATPSDFGEKGDRPTHPELLDWLADEFMHKSDWSLKDLHRLIVTSDAYRQQSIAPDVPRSALDDPRSIDPENALLWHFPYRRLDAEAIRDSMLAASGRLNRQMGGPAVKFPIQAAAVEAHTDKQSAWKPATEPDISRRTVYGYVKRTLLVPMLESLDFCDTTQSTDARAITSVAPQALTLYNGEFVNQQAEDFAERLEREAKGDRGRQVDLAFRLALARLPTEQEREAIEPFLATEADPHRGLVQVCRVILNLNEFVYPN